MAIDRIVNVGEEKRSSRKSGLLGRLLLLAAVMTLIGGVAISVAVSFEFVDIRVAILGLLVCVASSLGAHIAGEYPEGDDYFAMRLALSMAVRTGPPFLLVIVAKLVPGLPFERGFVFLIVLFYIVGLIVDVGMHGLRLKQSE